MTGLEKMKNQILDEAKSLAEAKVSDAENQAQEILEAAKAEAAKTAAGISQKSEADVANYTERIASSIDLQRRTRVLSAKQEVIAEVLNKAYEKLKAMETADYFAMMMKILDKYVLAQAGEIYFSQADVNRMPADCRAEIEKIAKAKGGSLKICSQEKGIEGGFVLAYGGIEENCTLRAMFDAKRDELSDEAHRLLFS
ncbi:V-type ATP synthase subunit E [Dorea acetigenes]|jgi:V/A-type H+-transporting ATPase subunit E|uniref:V-type proton ATPase subunit E n=1 Tax=Dorea acetigenes TaxID=2981787 RepID=A0ABT2RLF9_9FIRM|nr:V-type ATP synthase subunit E [Dorea acetigenes]MCB6414333.1 V-type ATP synthase subunit E [Faecalimonas umbilicata]MCU6686243.1 V-type ATP synthase subunit E [Dorea acetigenes]SCI85477.1 V-type ATP synthase subunit E [uncultured Clostridium sp.]